ncbi:MAG TPA: UDP-N-acetylmuramate--L-alanine ligase, partial [Vineibacter terrae]|nr:UDP-N-acetylmuramate--L-alanine ligase [Vineibacter terrae]
ARQAYGGSGQVITVVQPHRFTRLRDLRDEFARCFGDADLVIVADVYPAGEAPIAGVDKEMLIGAIQQAGHAHVMPLSAPGELPELLWTVARPGDVVICLGAGSISGWAYALPDQIRQLAQERAAPRVVAITPPGRPA